MLYYCKTPQGNFGDNLNPLLWPRLAPEVCDPQGPALFVGIGTILSHKVPREPLEIVFGSGWGGGPLPKIDGKWNDLLCPGPHNGRHSRIGSRARVTLISPKISLH
jgi:succinoglycan biosynthesis protein ExoV